MARVERQTALKCPECPSVTVHWTGMQGNPGEITDSWRCLLCLHEFTTVRPSHSSDTPEDPS